MVLFVGIHAGNALGLLSGDIVEVGLLLEDKYDCEVIVGELDAIEEIVGDVAVLVDNGNGCVDEGVAEFMDDV